MCMRSAATRGGDNVTRRTKRRLGADERPVARLRSRRALERRLCAACSPRYDGRTLQCNKVLTNCASRDAEDPRFVQGRQNLASAFPSELQASCRNRCANRDYLSTPQNGEVINKLPEVLDGPTGPHHTGRNRRETHQEPHGALCGPSFQASVSVVAGYPHRQKPPTTPGMVECGEGVVAPGQFGR
jgi:hypothetical protein